MACPHTAGMLAYLISIYPSDEFNFGADGNLFPSAVTTTVSQRNMHSMYSLARAKLPHWMSFVLPQPLPRDVTPAVLPVLTPAQLKKALLELATKDVL